MGLCNGSATCYMNAVFQQLFMQPAVRALVLSAPEVPQPARRESVFYHLQVGPCEIPMQPLYTAAALTRPLSCLKRQ